MQSTKDEIREFDNFPWHCATKTFKGVTLKHVFDNISSYPSEIPCTKGSPLKSIESIFIKFLEAGSNINLKPNPKEFPLLPDSWYDWTTPMTA